MGLEKIYLVMQQSTKIRAIYHLISILLPQEGVSTKYLTGQNYSLELMFAKFSTAKNREKLNPLTFTPSGVTCLTTKLEQCVIIEIMTTRSQDRLQVRRSITEL